MNWKSIISVMVLVMLAASVSACGKKKVVKARFIEKIPLRTVESQIPEGKLNAMVIFMADQFERNLDKEILREPVIVLPFFELDRAGKTSELGELMAENLMHELQVRGWKVLDVNLVNDILADSDGEFVFRDDMVKVSKFYDIGSAVRGTYSVTVDRIVANARVVDVNSGIVVSSGQFSMSLEGIEPLLLDHPVLKEYVQYSIKKKMEKTKPLMLVDHPYLKTIKVSGE